MILAVALAIVALVLLAVFGLAEMLRACILTPPLGSKA